MKEALNSGEGFQLRLNEQWSNIAVETEKWC
jgi:hypothetical protein